MLNFRKEEVALLLLLTGHQAERFSKGMTFELLSYANVCMDGTLLPRSGRLLVLSFLQVLRLNSAHLVR